MYTFAPATATKVFVSLLDPLSSRALSCTAAAGQSFWNQRDLCQKETIGAHLATCAALILVHTISSGHFRFASPCPTDVQDGKGGLGVRILPPSLAGHVGNGPVQDVESLTTRNRNRNLDLG